MNNTFPTFFFCKISKKCYYFFRCIIGTFFIFTLLATGFHCWYMRKRKRFVSYNVDALRAKKPKLFYEVVICFSCVNTIGKFLHVKPNDLNLECICGIKFLSMSLIIVGHSLIFIFGGPVVNRGFFKEVRGFFVMIYVKRSFLWQS